MSGLKSASKAGCKSAGRRTPPVLRHPHQLPHAHGGIAGRIVALAPAQRRGRHVYI